MKTTNQHKKFWSGRKIDWEKSYLTGIDEVSGQPMWNHPHRQLIMWALAEIESSQGMGNRPGWISLWEIGCGAGANLMKIVKTFKGKQIGGSDINADAIEVAKKTFTGGRFRVESAEDIFLSDSSVDVMLSDASLIYISPGKIKGVINEMVRVTRNNIVLCEFHNTSLLKRWLFRLKTGYNSYDYQQLLEDAGCYDIKVIKIPESFWQGEPWKSWGYIISAKISK